MQRVNYSPKTFVDSELILKFGIALPNSGPLASPTNIRLTTEKVEELGLHTLWVHDQISYGRDWLGHRASGVSQQITPETEPNLYESISTLCYVAAITRGVSLGTAILVLPLRNPLVLGRQLLTLQTLSEGRAILGIAIGDYPAEFKVMNVPYEKRATITEEYLDALQKILRGGSVTHHGELISFDEAQLYPKVTPPPILIGGGVIAVPEPQEDKLAMSVLRRVAKYGDGWFPDWGTPDLIERGVTSIRNLAKDYGRSSTRFEIALSTAMYLSDGDQDAINNTLQSLEFGEQEANLVAKIGTRTPKKTLDRSLIGSRRTLVSKIESYANAGVSHFKLTTLTPDIRSTLQMIEKFAAEVAGSFV